MAQHTVEELRTRQAYPLELKISLTESRIRGWVNEYGEDGVYVSFSGGKDSTVLLDIIRNRMGYKDIPAVFVDVPTQFPELKEFAKTWDNVEILKPKISFMQVCEKYGFPLISKEVSDCVTGAKRYLTPLKEEQGVDKLSEIVIDEELAERMMNDKYKRNGSVRRSAILLGVFTKNNEIKTTSTISTKDKSKDNHSNFKFLLDAPFEVSGKCCEVMKKNPLHEYTKRTKRKPITAQMADESRMRMKNWLANGCNGFNMKNPISNPMSFWTEQDILSYIYKYNIPICSVYGDIVEDFEAEGIMENQITFDDFNCDKIYKTTGCKRTGCMLCGFGCHLEKEGDSRFEILKEIHPKMYNLLDIIKNNDVTFREAIEWTNEHGNLNIKL